MDSGLKSRRNDEIRNGGPNIPARRLTPSPARVSSPVFRYAEVQVQGARRVLVAGLDVGEQRYVNTCPASMIDKFQPLTLASPLSSLSKISLKFINNNVVKMLHHCSCRQFGKVLHLSCTEAEVIAERLLHHRPCDGIYWGAEEGIRAGSAAEFTGNVRVGDKDGGVN
jgi:hypothetical protein